MIDNTVLHNYYVDSQEQQQPQLLPFEVELFSSVMHQALRLSYSKEGTTNGVYCQ